MANKIVHLIGIAGSSSSGKTTLTKELKRRNKKFSILSFDEYDLYPSGSKQLSKLTKKVKNWEDPVLFDNVRYIQDVNKLKAGSPIKLKSRSRESLEKGIKKRIIRPESIVIIEGILSFYDSRIRNLFSLRIFVNIPPREMIKRRSARTQSRSTDPWDAVDYVKKDLIKGTNKFVTKQKGHAHLVINGLLPVKKQANLVIEAINKITSAA